MDMIWATARAGLAENLTEQDVRIWIEPLRPLRMEDQRLVLGCPNSFFLSWVKERFHHRIQDAVKQAAEAGQAEAPDVVLEVAPPARAADAPPAAAQKQYELPKIEARTRSPLRFNPRFTFDRFVVGENNQLAFYAANALARGQELNTNSLFILSDPGLGKSHLSQALSQHYLALGQNPRVFYLTAEDFTNEMVYSLKNRCVDDFKRKYRRSCDLLVLEEVHFLSGKEKVQAELSYTLDYLAENNKKVVFTSARRPKDIPRLGRGFVSRLNGSLISTIEAPDFPTRERILRAKAKESGLDLPGNVIEFMAEKLTRDVRRMESCLNSLAARSRLLQRPIDLRLAKESLADLVDDQAEAPTAEAIRNLVCRQYQVSEEDLKSKSRRKNVVLPRNLGMYLCRKMTDMSLEDIGRVFSRNHSTVLYSINATEHRSRKDPKLKGQIEFLMHKLQQNEPA